MQSASRFQIASLFFLAFTAAAYAQPPQETYEPHPDSIKQAGVPEGKVEGPFEWKSKIYPGTVRNYHLYIPTQYNPEKAACTFIVQDGWNRAKEWKLPTVMDNLIAKGEMPVTIGIFIDHGVVPAPNDKAQPRFNRSFEYDGLGDRYARFLIDEISTIDRSAEHLREQSVLGMPRGNAPTSFDVC
jgi:gluconolactonase